MIKIMADIADQAGELIDAEEANNLARIRKAASEMVNHGAGICDYCEEEFTRLVHGACGRCRDEFKL